MRKKKKAGPGDDMEKPQQELFLADDEDMLALPPSSVPSSQPQSQQAVAAITPTAIPKVTEEPKKATSEPQTVSPEPIQKLDQEPQAPQAPEAKPKPEPSPVIPAAPVAPSVDTRTTTTTSVDAKKDEQPVEAPEKRLSTREPVPVLQLKRETTIHYYRQLYAFHSYPLTILFSEKKLAKLKAKVKAMEQTTGKGFAVEPSKPLVKVVAHFPGCLTTPNELTVDVTPPETLAKFWITPLTHGKIEDAYVQIWYQNKCIDQIAIPMQVYEQTPAKIAAWLGILLPFISFVWDIFGPRLVARFPSLNETWLYILTYMDPVFQSVGGIFRFTLLLSASLFLMAILFYWARSNKTGKPIFNQVALS